MRLTHTTGYWKDAAWHAVPLIERGSRDILRVLYVAIFVICSGCHREPPDLTACTRMDIQYTAGALNYFFPYTSMQQGVLSKEESAYIGSFDTWTLTDQEQITAFADRIHEGQYQGRLWDIIDDDSVDITCYKGSERVGSFSMYSKIIVTANKRQFAYPRFLGMRSLAPPQIRPLKVRWECAMNLSRLVSEGLWWGQGHRDFPDPNHWCDAVLAGYRTQHIICGDEGGRKERTYPDPAIASRFMCPGVHAPTDMNDTPSQPDATNSSSPPPVSWMSDYAMNAHCRADSPKDMVFLFESRSGWNQHGGPELFTFDNHDPRGGLVLLNDGTVKFIRTEEELKQLRWK